jgi:hypothetical protein
MPMYNPYSLDLAHSRQQELIAEADLRRVAKAVRKPRWVRRALAGRPTDADIVRAGRQSTARPALPLRA